MKGLVAVRSRSLLRKGAMVAGVLMVGLSILSSCAPGATPEGEAPAEGEIRYGQPVEMGTGVARTYIRMEGEAPVEVGISLSEGALAGLPADGAAGGATMPDGHSTFEIALEMPSENPTPFRHAVMDWNPAGHEPPGIYDQPHLDFHFYTIEPHERHEINPTDSAFLEKGARTPDPSLVPAGYILPEIAPVPLMGAHWLNPNSPELRQPNPELFTHTFLYGSWDGRMIFAEPMITVAFLESRPAIRVPVGVAGQYEPDGYYPSAYGVHWDADAAEYRIALADLEWRE